MSAEDVPDSPFEAVDGAEPGDTQVTGGGVLGRAFDGSVPGPSVQQLETDYHLDFHWAVALRGFTRMMVGDGIPPIFEAFYGSTLGIVKSFKSDDPLDSSIDVYYEGEGDVGDVG